MIKKTDTKRAKQTRKKEEKIAHEKSTKDQKEHVEKLQVPSSHPYQEPYSYQPIYSHPYSDPYQQEKSKPKKTEKEKAAEKSDKEPKSTKPVPSKLKPVKETKVKKKTEHKKTSRYEKGREPKKRSKRKRMDYTKERPHPSDDEYGPPYYPPIPPPFPQQTLPPPPPAPYQGHAPYSGPRAPPYQQPPPIPGYEPPQHGTPISPYPYPYPPYPPYPPHQEYPPQYYLQMPRFSTPKILKKMKDIPLLTIFLVIISVYWIPYILAGLIGLPFFSINSDFAELIAGIALCILTIALMLLVRSNLDRPTMKDYGLSTDNLGKNLWLTVKLIFIIYAVESIVVYFFQYLGVSFEGGPTDINIYFLLSAVIIAPIFEETVYRMNASTLLARRLPIIWVSIITSTWFIAKHIPMWHFDDQFGLPALGVILLVDIPLWTIVTYYYLKLKCIWIPFIVHMFNNAAIAMFYYLPESLDIIFNISFLLIGIIFLAVFGIPWFYKRVLPKLADYEIKITPKNVRYLMISLLLIVALLGTSEAWVSVQRFSEYLCLPIGFAFFVVSILTIALVLSNRSIIYVEDDDTEGQNIKD